MSEERITVFDSQGEPYERAFATFLANTDQKQKARAFIEELVELLPRREVLVDAGAGTGALTSWLAPSFERAYAIEPSPFLRRQLTANCPKARLLESPILETELPETADLIVCSHVLYYIDSEQWLANLERLASWLGTQGLLLVILQNPGSDCMKLLERFHAGRFDLRPLAKAFEDRNRGRYAADIGSIECFTWGRDLETAMVIAEFMLNLLPPTTPPKRSDVSRFLEGYRSEDGYRLSCTQDVLLIRPRGIGSLGGLDA